MRTAGVRAQAASQEFDTEMREEILNRIHNPEDLKKLSMQELSKVGEEIREKILETVSRNGGHLASGLGVIELTIALHRVFHAPADKLLWDVGHQSYPHKLLTGRAGAFSTLRTFGGLNGFCCPGESEYDPFISGHAGNAVSAAMGFSVANQLAGRDDHVIAVVGDGGLINGITLEALNNLRSTCKKMIVVVNDNKMSIGKSIGAIPRYLNSLITGRNYNRFKAFAKMSLGHLPGGKTIISGIRQIQNSTKNLFVPGLFFEEMGLRYIGPIYGHDIAELVKTFERIKEFNRPVLVHVITEKGHGCEYVAESPEAFHGVGAFDLQKGLAGGTDRKTFSRAFGEELDQLAEKEEKIVAITAAMASGCGISASFIDSRPDRFFDVGIAEEHALTFAGGLAAAGLRPVVAIYATFLQRALDSLYHDICLADLPVMLCIDRAGAVEDGPTHHGIYDLSFLQTMPNLSILLPESEEVLKEMMRLVLQQKHPAAIRYPRGSSGLSGPAVPVQWGKSFCDREGCDLAIWACGRELATARETAQILQEEYGVRAAVHGVRFLKPFDETAFLASASAMPVVTLEDNCKRGGFASLAADLLIRNGAAHRGVLSFGWENEPVVAHGAVQELRREAGLLPEQIAEQIAERFQYTKEKIYKTTEPKQNGEEKNEAE